jgi:hypothetical protein
LPLAVPLSHPECQSFDAVARRKFRQSDSDGIKCADAACWLYDPGSPAPIGVALSDRVFTAPEAAYLYLERQETRLRYA